MPDVSRFEAIMCEDGNIHIYDQKPVIERRTGMGTSYERFEQEQCDAFDDLFSCGPHRIVILSEVVEIQIIQGKR